MVEVVIKVCAVFKKHPQTNSWIMGEGLPLLVDHFFSPLIYLSSGKTYSAALLRLSSDIRRPCWTLKYSECFYNSLTDMREL